ncbi:MAG: hypothetical protein LAO76_12770 [Acidobacteriia bacterium]|nr:hypothetical protein [Terriglobia bacterium]
MGPNKSVEEDLKKGLKSLKRNAIATRILTFTNILGAFGSIPYSLYTISNQKSNLIEKGFALLGLCLISYGFVWFMRLYKAARRPLSSRPGCVIVPPVLADLLAEMSHPFMQRMCIKPEAVYFYVNQRKLSGGPSVHVTKNGNEIEIPLSFVKLANFDKAAARACMQHELAHVAHGDAKSWAFASVFWHVLTRIAIPIRGLALALALILMVVAQVQYGNARQEIDKARTQVNLDYSTALTKIKATPNADIDLNKSFLDIQRDSALMELDTALSSADQRTDVLISSVGSIVGVGFLALLLLSLRRDRWLAERLADTEAIIYGNGDDLIRGLQFLSKSTTVNLFSLHPSLAKRIEYINKSVASVIGAMPRHAASA